MPRPKEQPRIRRTIRILPETNEAIELRVRRGDRKANTPGKVIDESFKAKA